MKEDVGRTFDFLFFSFPSLLTVPRRASPPGPRPALPGWPDPRRPGRRGPRGGRRRAGPPRGRRRRPGRRRLALDDRPSMADLSLSLFLFLSAIQKRIEKARFLLVLGTSEARALSSGASRCKRGRRRRKRECGGNEEAAESSFLLSASSLALARTKKKRRNEFYRARARAFVLSFSFPIFRFLFRDVFCYNSLSIACA